MSSRGRRCRRRLTILLAIWMTVVSLGISVTHAHESGSSPHVHGFGWTGAWADVADQLGSATGSGHPEERHRHLLLLGWELPGDTPTDTIRPEALSAQPAAGPAVDRPADDPTDTGHPPPFPFGQPPADPSDTARSLARPVVALSFSARRAAAGLLRC